MNRLNALLREPAVGRADRRADPGLVERVLAEDRPAAQLLGDPIDGLAQRGVRATIERIEHCQAVAQELGGAELRNAKSHI